MIEPTNQQAYGGMAAPVEKQLDDGAVISGSARSLFLSGFIVTLIASVAQAAWSGDRHSVSDTLLLGLAGAICFFIGVAIPLFISWGCAVAIGCRLNGIFGKPLNASAIAAVASNLAFFLTLMLVSGLGSALYGNMFTIVIVFAGSFLFQFTARVAVAKQIARHNAQAGHKRYTEPPCHVQFQIRQLLILMFLVAAGIALLRESSAKAILPELMVLVGGATVILVAVFYPAIVAAANFQKKFGKVRLKTWEQPRPLGPEPVEIKAMVSTVAKVDPFEEPMISAADYRESARVSRFDGHRAAIDWISWSGAMFAMWLVVVIEISKNVHHECNYTTPGLWSAIPLGFAGLFFSLVLSRILLTSLWVFFEWLCRPGTLVAITGGVIGALGAYVVLLASELVHFNVGSGLIDLDGNNLFPLAVVLYGALVGQTMRADGN